MQTRRVLAKPITIVYLMFRFAYAVVDDEYDDYEPVQGPNENFGKIPMRIHNYIRTYVCTY